MNEKKKKIEGDCNIPKIIKKGSRKETKIKKNELIVTYKNKMKIESKLKKEEKIKIIELKLK